MTNQVNSDANAIQQMLIETVLGEKMGIDVEMAKRLLAENYDIVFETDLGFTSEKMSQYQQETVKAFRMEEAMAVRTLNQTTNRVLDYRLSLAA